MEITLVTLFPEMFYETFNVSIIKKAQKNSYVHIHFVNPRDFSSDSYKSVDDHPYGGGAGMILRVDIMDRALSFAKNQFPQLPCRSILLDPQGIPFTQKVARRLSVPESHLILVCGHYEGIDERIRNLVDEEISLGDFILTGGEIPGMAIIDSVVRLLPNVLSKKSIIDESFNDNLLEYPQYTRPHEYKGEQVPSVLLSGNHAHIAVWRKQEALKRTKRRRPDLLTGQTDLNEVA